MEDIIVKGIFFIISFGFIFVILSIITSVAIGIIYLFLDVIFKRNILKKYACLIMVIPLVVLLVNRAIRMLTTKEVYNSGMFIFGGRIPYYPNSFQFIFDVEIMLSTVIIIISLLITFYIQKKKGK